MKYYYSSAHAPHESPSLVYYRHTHTKHIPLASSTIIIVHSVDMHNIRAQAMKRVNGSSGKCVFVSRLGIFLFLSPSELSTVGRRYCVLARAQFLINKSKHDVLVRKFSKKKTLCSFTFFIVSTFFYFCTTLRFTFYSS